METWNNGDAYDAYVGRWSRPVARKFISRLAVPPAARWLDVGCGTGALAGTILGTASPGLVVAVDASETYAAYANARTRDPRASFHVADAGRLPFPDACFDVAVSGLVLNFLPQADRACRELARVVRPGGLVSAYVWDYAGDMQLMRRFWDAAVALNPAAHALDEGQRFPLCRPDALERLFVSAGLADVEVGVVDVETRFRDFDDYWSPFLGGQGPAPTYVGSLDEGGRQALRERLRTTLPRDGDQSITLNARALAVRGRVAGSSSAPLGPS